MHASFWNSVLIVAVAAAATFLTRVIPFAAFGKRKIPQTVDYLGRILPPAIIATLVVYCLRNVDFISGYHGAAEIIAVAVICVLHLWRRNTPSFGRRRNGCLYDTRSGACLILRDGEFSPSFFVRRPRVMQKARTMRASAPRRRKLWQG